MSQNNILNHITTRIKADVEFLVAEGLMSRYDADIVANKLPSVAEEHSQSHKSGLVSPPSSNASTPVSERIAPFKKAAATAAAALGRTPARPAPAPSSSSPQAKALWGYNEDGSEPADLSFPAGATIEIVEETNADWWKGRYQGREGLLPSSYVEKLPPSSSSSAPSFPEANSASPPSDPEKAAMYSGNSGAMHPRFVPPPPPGGGYMPPPSQQNQWNPGPYSPHAQQWSQGGPPAGYQHSPPPPPPPEGGVPEKKKSKFGKYGSQAGSAAASGVGFGAGAAIGGGIVNAIF